MVTKLKEPVSFCGLCCAECFGYQGKIADLARDLREELRATRFDLFADFMSGFNFGKTFQDYEACYNVLGGMVKFRCKKGCKDGGGPPFCKMRKCCQKKGYQGCWECDEFETCEKLDFLNPVHGDAHRKNLKAIRKKGIEEFLKGKKLWYSKPKTLSK